MDNEAQIYFHVLVLKGEIIGYTINNVSVSLCQDVMVVGDVM